MYISTYSLAETFDVGQDTGTQVSAMYGDPFPFSGVLERVTFNVSDVHGFPARDMPTQNYCGADRAALGMQPVSTLILAAG